MKNILWFLKTIVNGTIARPEARELYLKNHPEKRDLKSKLKKS